MKFLLEELCGSLLKILSEILLMVKEKKKPTLRNNLLLTDEVLQL